MSDNDRAPSDPELRAYGPFVTSGDVADLVAANRSSAHAARLLCEAIDGLSLKIRALVSATDMLRDMIEKLCHGMGITVE